MTNDNKRRLSYNELLSNIINNIARSFSYLIGQSGIVGTFKAVHDTSTDSLYV